MTAARRRTITALFALLAVGAVLVLVRAAGVTDADAGQRLARQLSCPTCAGQSVAESDSPVAAGMRKTITDQLAAGRSPDQIRAWFVDRYGPDVLRGNAGPTTMLIVVAVVAVAVTVIVVIRRRRRTDDPDLPQPAPPQRHRRAILASVGVLLVAVVGGVAAGSWWLSTRTDAATNSVAEAADPLSRQLAAAADSESRGDYASAAQAYRRAADISADPAIKLQLAFAQLRAGQVDAALAVAGAVHRAAPDDPDAMLILGLAQRASAAPDAQQTLTRFLAMAPRHPAAAEVRRLLGEPATPPMDGGAR